MQRASGLLRPMELFDNPGQLVDLLIEGPRSLLVSDHCSGWETVDNQRVSQSAWQMLRHPDFEEEYYLVGNTRVPS